MAILSVLVMLLSFQGVEPEPATAHPWGPDSVEGNDGWMATPTYFGQFINNSAGNSAFFPLPDA
jgi:hypothetical protein